MDELPSWTGYHADEAAFIRAETELEWYPPAVEILRREGVPGALKRIPRIASAITTLLSIPEQDLSGDEGNESQLSKLPIFDGTYDLGELVATQAPIDVLLFLNDGKHLQIFGIREEADARKQEYAVSLPFVVPDDINMLEARSLTAIDTSSEEKISYDFLAKVEEQQIGYLNLLGRAISGIRSTISHEGLWEEYNKLTQNLRESRESEYADVWTRLQLFANQGVAHIQSTKDLIAACIPVGEDIAETLERSGIRLEVSADWPSSFEVSGKQDQALNSDGKNLKRGVMAYKLEDRLLIAGMDVGSDGDTQLQYTVYVPDRPTTVGMHADEYNPNGGRFEPDKHGSGMQDYQGYAGVLQAAVRDVLAYVPTPEFI